MSAATTDAEISFRNTRMTLTSEGLGTAEAGQRRNARLADGQIAGRAAGLSTDDQPGNPAIDDRRPEPTAVGKLIHQSIRNIFNRTVDQDLVVRRAVGV